MAQFATEEWINLWADAINNSKAYEAAAQTWEGDFYMIVEAGGPFKEPVYQYIDLWHGKCRKATVAKNESDYKPEFVLSAPQSIWRRVAEKKLDPIQAIVTRQLKLKGNMAKIMRAVKAAQELVNSVTQVKTEYLE
jgi:putative sterol carrier protein